MTIGSDPVVNLCADRVDVWHDHYRTNELQNWVWLQQKQLRHAVVAGVNLAAADELDLGGRFLFGEPEIGELGPLVWLRVDGNQRVLGNPVGSGRAESAVTVKDQSVCHLVIRRQCDDSGVGVTLEFNLADFHL